MAERAQLLNRVTLTCPVCGETGFRNLAGHCLHKHKLNPTQVREQTGYEGLFISSAQARLMAARSNLLWQSPETHARRVNGIKEAYTEDLRKRRSDKCTDEWTRGTRAHAPMTLLRRELRERAGNKCERCGILEEEEYERRGTRLALHHKNYDRTIPQLEDVELLCSSCHTEHHGPGKHDKTVRLPRVAKAVGELLKALGVDLADENFVETPRRFAAYLLEHFGDGSEFDKSLEEFEGAVFPSEYQGIIAQEFTAVGICPHHLLPVRYQGVIAYIPEEVTIGLSKLARMGHQCLRYPILQEFGTLLLADTASETINTPHVAVMLRAEHLCMTVRGVRAHGSTTVTSELRGFFFDKPDTRSEFMSLAMAALSRKALP